VVVFTGGGTGGHLVIIDSVAEHIEKKIYIGSTSGQDQKWFANDDRFIKKIFLETTGVVNKKGLAKLYSLKMLASAIKQIYPIIKQSDAVFSVGGFSAAPAAIAAIIARKPLFIHEQNSVKGRLNQLLKPFAFQFIESFGDDRTSYPVKDIYFDLARIRKKLQTIIFLGGSQGARAINTIALEVAKRYKYKIIHQCGEKDFDWLQHEYKKMNVRVDLFPFSKDLAQKMAQADFAVARAGASTLWELCANRLPTLFIPYPFAASDHQYYNAKTLVDLDCAWLVEEKRFEVEFFELLSDAMIEEKSIKLGSVIQKGGAKEIARIIKQAL